VFDTSLLTPAHLWLFGSCFAAVWAGLFFLVRRQPSWLRVPGKNDVVYGGAWLACCLLAAAACVMPQQRALLVSLGMAGIVTVIAGFLDERRAWPAGRQLGAQLVIACIAVTGGWAIPYVTNMFGGGVVSLQWVQAGAWWLPSAAVSVIWLVALMNAVNWLDGIDGLAGTVAGIAFAALIAISLLPATQDGLTLSLAVIGAAAMLGFVVWNIFPARIYLGTTGSWMVGLYLGVIAMIGGGKIVTTVLVLAWPIADALAVIVQRVQTDAKLWQGDKRHLHWRLLARGFSPSAIVAGAALISLLLAAAAVLLPTAYKVLVFIAVAVAAVVLI
jgi:UDP-N-acetylmuramyl pentapeptide phosphotransferase/UDP-N-acetylglucosamine-1-phosphate transferase